MKSSQTTKALLKISACGIIFLIVGAISYYLALPEKTVAQRSEDYKQALKKGASTATHLLIEEYLKTTNKVQHPLFGEPGESIAISMSNVFIVSSWIDSENSQGKLWRRHYTAKVKYLPPTKKWVLTKVTFSE